MLLQMKNNVQQKLELNEQRRIQLENQKLMEYE